MTTSLPDVPRMADPGLYEFLQAVRRQVLANSGVIADAQATLADVSATNDGLLYKHEIPLSGSTVLTPEQAGSHVQLNTIGATFTLPGVASLPDGATFSFHAGGGGNIIKPSVGENFWVGGGINLAQITMGAGDDLVLGKSTPTAWTGEGTATLKYAPGFEAMNHGGWYQRLPSGLIMQFGVVSPTAVNVQQLYPLPIPFPLAGGSLTLTPYGGANVPAKANGYFPDTSHFSASIDVAGVALSYFAIGS